MQELNKKSNKKLSTGSFIVVIITFLLHKLEDLINIAALN
jgi:hypothetical protein